MEKKRNEATELVFILDRSGSMAGLESDTVGGFNSLIAKQKKQTGDCFVTTVLFSGESRRIHDRVPLADVAPMTDADYTVGGCTALLDALGDTIGHISEIHKYIRPEDVPAHTLFVITTDGMENASRRFRADEIRKMIEEKKKLGWEFLFLAANIDAAETAAGMGIEADRAVNYKADEKGTETVYACLAEAVSCARKSEKLSKNWSQEIELDYKNRG